MGHVYLYLIKQFVDAANQKAGSFCTPRRLVLLMVAIADPQEGEMVYALPVAPAGYALRSVDVVLANPP